MLNLNIKTKLKPEEVIKKAKKFFGAGGYSLNLVNENATCADFEGGGGGVAVKTCLDENCTSVDLQTREWEYQVKEFADTIK